MKNLLTCVQLASLDKEAICDYGIPSIILIEHAAFGACSILKKEIKDFENKNILIICGKGNNAGDGLALARNIYYLGNKNIICALTEDEGSESFNIELNICKKLNIKLIESKEIEKYFDKTELIIDALYGTGFKPPLRKEGELLIKKINALKGKTIISLDIPSGLSDTTSFSDLTVKSDITITFGKNKVCFYPSENRSKVGKLFLVNPGFPLELLDKYNSRNYVYTFSDLNMKKIKDTVYKNNRGHVAIFVGDKGKFGASILAGKAAFEMGSGLVTLIGDIACKEDINFPQFMHEDKIDKESHFSSILFGNGRIPNKENQKLLEQLLVLDKPTVLDAGALRMLKDLDEEIFKFRKSSLILTPHLGEFSSMQKEKLPDYSVSYVENCLKLANIYNATIVIKSYITWVVSKEGIFIYDNPNSALAVAGSGDVLSGCITSLLGQGLDDLTSCLNSVALHNQTGFEINKEKSYFDALELANSLGKTLKENI